SSLEVDYEFELGRLNNRQVNRFCTAEDFADVNRCLSVGICKAGAITCQASRFRKLAKKVDARTLVRRRGSYDLLSPVHKERIGGQDKATNPVLRELAEATSNFKFVAGLNNLDLPSNGLSRRGK